MVKINGEQKDKAGMTIEEYLAEAGLSKGRVAVERNGEIVPRDMYGETRLKDGDSVEIVNFVGGG
ncbi:MAG TPA: sulfur carrier protein ThiS [Candidatus Copromorpha excrementigallinarum]|uniref:Sulfur carrier protein ThiS n=1 Tax=Candidatus Allocopromorpha excrementigallinarum TaxID=2840742 RepID=A0A9D1I495_9FIRM|nr:sulfur carrier protein ThiS [Candidatus Copromorpha excrementigallinarum]